MPIKIFAAYPSKPAAIGQVIESAREKVPTNRVELLTWPQNDACGLPLTDPIFENICSSDAVFADITRLNFNVTFEAGYSIGKKKRTFLFMNDGLTNDLSELQRIGIFDTLGYDSYENSDELSNHLSQLDKFKPLNIDYKISRGAPIYLVEMPKKTEAMTRIISCVKKTRLRYRSFNPDEHIRLSATDAIYQVSSSFGVLVPLASDNIKDAMSHNIRAAFVAGLAIGMGKPVLLMQEYGGPVPLDVRDLAQTYKHPNDINDLINAFALKVVASMQEISGAPRITLSKLAELTVGDPMAENEFDQLGNYYLQTDEYQRAVRGEVNLVVGRKGMGKTALFSQLRNEKRRNKINIVVDLKPEGYQLVRLKESILRNCTDGTKEYLLTAFWTYILYLEICYKILEKDENRHLQDSKLYDKYIELYGLYNSDQSLAEGDFSERLLRLSESIINEFNKSFSESDDLLLSSGQLTEIIYKHDINVLKNKISEYLSHKESTWILFDNLDKGWPSSGLESVDILILRCLIEANKKILRDMRKEGHEFFGVVFIRNDVYELLMEESPDFGKELRVSLDWTDVDLMKAMMRRRINSSLGSNEEFETVWNSICVSHYKGENSFHYLMERSIMRPRNIIKMFIHCKGYAVNLEHDRIESIDIEKGIETYSNDILIEADQELRDIDLASADLLYRFIGENPKLAENEITEIFKEHGVNDNNISTVLDFLLYFGFVGVCISGGDPVYIYDNSYNLKLLKARIHKFKEEVVYYLNPAFWPALGISPAA